LALDFEINTGICSQAGSKDVRALTLFMGNSTPEKGTKMNVKMEYEAPTLVEVGSFEEITQGAGCPGTADFNVFDGTTPIGPDFVPTCS